VIKTFAHKGLERYFVKEDRRLLDAKQLPRIERLLDALDQASVVDVLDCRASSFTSSPVTARTPGA